MAEIIRMPRMSDTMEEGNIVEWLVAEGDEVEPGQTLAEVETDKATMELDSYFEGVLLHIAVREGAVPIDGVIAVIGDEGEDWKAALASAGSEGGSSDDESASDNEPVSDEERAPANEEAAPAKQETPSGDVPATTTDYSHPTPTSDHSKSGTPGTAAASASAAGNDDRIKASPLARAMAKEAGLDLASISGSGDGGRIVKADVEQAKSNPAAQPSVAPAAAPAASPSAAAPPAGGAAPATPPPAPNVPAFAFNAGGDNYDDAPVSQMRKAVSRLVSNSKFTAPHFYVTVEINMGKVWEFRKKINEVAPVKISFNDLIVKACAINLPKHPVINSSWRGDTIRTHHDVHISCAVAVPDGLFMPVVRYANLKSLSQINVEVKDLVGRAKQRKLGQEEMTGSTFSVSNLGMFGIEEFTAILNTPNSCILAVGGINDKAIVVDGQVVAGRMMKVTLSCDHRTVDGASAAAFLNDVKASLENPVRLMI